MTSVAKKRARPSPSPEPNHDTDTRDQANATAEPVMEDRLQRARTECHAVIPLPDIDGAEIVFENDYVFVDCEGEDDVDRPSIGFVVRIFDGCKRVRVRWLYHPVAEGLRGEFGRNELLMSHEEDTISWDSILDVAGMVERCPDCTTSEMWCWNKHYDPRRRRIVSEDGARKRRKTRR
jgi:hypothetical protein